MISVLLFIKFLMLAGLKNVFNLRKISDLNSLDNINLNNSKTSFYYFIR